MSTIISGSIPSIGTLAALTLERAAAVAVQATAAK